MCIHSSFSWTWNTNTFLRSTKCQWGVKLKLVSVQDLSVIFVKCQISRSDLITSIIQREVKQHLGLFTQLHGTRPFTRVHKSEEKWQCFPLQCEFICLLLQAFIIILLLQILSSYSYCGALVPSRQRNSLLNKADHMSSVTTTILRKASNGIPKFFGKCLFSSWRSESFFNILLLFFHYGWKSSQQ